MIKEKTPAAATTERVLRMLSKLYNQTAQMSYAFSHGMNEDGYQMALENERLAERMILEYRDIPINTGRPSAMSDVNRIIAEEVPVEMGYTQEGWFMLKIPELLPLKEKKKGSFEYIRGYLYPAMEHHFENELAQRIEKCVVIYRHIYAKDYPEKEYRDYDNIAVNGRPKQLFASDRAQNVSNINAYLVDGPAVFIDSRSKPLCAVPAMTTGNRPADGGHLIIEAEDYDAFIAAEPKAEKYIKKLVGSVEFINNKKRYCLWLVGANPVELIKMPRIMQRVEACRLDRENSPDAGRRKLADRPTQFRETNNPEAYIVVPAVSSERRKYVPMGFLGSDTIPTNLVTIIPDASVYHFGILTSNVHMAWMRAVCGRLKSDYRYSKDVVYNNFPWPTPTEEQIHRIEQTAQAILDARALYPDCSLADLYGDKMWLFPELLKAHQQNDKAVMQAYGFWGKLNTETECVAELMKMYQALTEK